jgi:hypothetical protein
MDTFGIFYASLVNFVPIWSILWPFGKVCSHLARLPHFGMLYQTSLAIMALGPVETDPTE